MGKKDNGRKARGRWKANFAPKVAEVLRALAAADNRAPSAEIEWLVQAEAERRRAATEAGK
jgi:hypothetical protein